MQTRGNSHALLMGIQNATPVLENSLLASYEVKHSRHMTH